MTKTAATPAPLRVRAQTAVLGLAHGDEVEIEDSPRVQVMLNAGHLVELDADGQVVPRVPAEEPAKAKAAEDTPKA